MCSATVCTGGCEWPLLLLMFQIMSIFYEGLAFLEAPQDRLITAQLAEAALRYDILSDIEVY